LRVRALALSLAAVMLAASLARAEDPFRIVVVVVEPARSDGFRASVNQTVASDALSLMTALQALCDGKNGERGDHLVLLTRSDVTLETLSNVLSIAAKPCLDARRASVFQFDRKRHRMWRFPASRDSDPANLSFSADPAAFRSLLP